MMAGRSGIEKTYNILCLISMALCNVISSSWKKLNVEDYRRSNKGGDIYSLASDSVFSGSFAISLIPIARMRGKSFPCPSKSIPEWVIQRMTLSLQNDSSLQQNKKSSSKLAQKVMSKSVVEEEGEKRKQILFGCLMSLSSCYFFWLGCG